MDQTRLWHSAVDIAAAAWDLAGIEGIQCTEFALEVEAVARRKGIALHMAGSEIQIHLVGELYAPHIHLLGYTRQGTAADRSTG